MSLTEIARELLDGLHAQLPESGFRLVGVEVHVGKMVDLDPEHLRAILCSLLPRVEVQVTVVDALLKCKDCGAEYPADEHPCPVCGSPNAELAHGGELQIVRAWGETIEA
ncbi:MAG: hydrogenase/urease maturation nickel metallochaperone HypA [Pseudomonadota bacterium]|nr:hydrogenase/urease maturation nickel metallochaperone HypA [Pseudomonadota bacterium]